MSRASSTPRSELTALDGIAAVITSVAIAGLLTIPLWLAPHFAAMYQALGGEIPLLTRAVLSPWFGPGCALLPLASLGYALAARKATLHSRRRLIVLGFVLAAGAGALCLVGLYLPLFSLAGAIES